MVGATNPQVSNNMNQIKGTWSFEDGCAVYTPRFGRQTRYTLKVIQDTLSSVRRNRSVYYTDDAWRAHIDHLERGRALFPVNFLHEHQA